jgi:hypothetical protein
MSAESAKRSGIDRSDIAPAPDPLQAAQTQVPWQARHCGSASLRWRFSPVPLHAAHTPEPPHPEHRAERPGMIDFYHNIGPIIAVRSMSIGAASEVNGSKESWRESLLKAYCLRNAVRVTGYCLMGNHVHLQRSAGERIRRCGASRASKGSDAHRSYGRRRRVRQAPRVAHEQAPAPFKGAVRKRRPTIRQINWSWGFSSMSPDYLMEEVAFRGCPSAMEPHARVARPGAERTFSI